jgi:plasmid stabilization system protein ParE
MNWKMEFRPEVELDIREAAAWYEGREQGLGSEFVEEIIRVWEEIVSVPLVGSVRHESLDIGWRYPARFPYRVIYRVNEEERSLLVIAVLHAARQEKHWQRRV